MKTTLASYILTAAHCVLGAGSAVAQTWETVDKFSLQDNLSADATDIGTGADSVTLYSVGRETIDEAGNEVAIVRKSVNSGASWTTVDAYSESTWPGATYRGFGAGANGTVFAAGELWDGNPTTGTKTWIVRESADGGANWATVDVFSQGPGAKPSCGDIKVNPFTGDVFAVGRWNASSNTGFYWLVRKRAGGASSFSEADRVGAPPINDARAVGFHPTAGVFVVGRMGDGKNRALWTVRRSADRGVTWTTVDTFQDAAKTDSEARGIAVSASGAIYVCGRAIQSVKGSLVNNWVVRRSLNGGVTWTTVDRFGAGAAPYGIGETSATGITIAPSGAVFITGNTADPSHIIARKGTTASNGTMSWVTSDNYQLVNGQAADAQAITCDAAGNIFTTGKAEIDSTGLRLFLTRKLAGPQ